MSIKRKLLPALAIAGALVMATPAIAQAAPSSTVSTVTAVAPAIGGKIVPMACGYRTEYRWNDFRCWQVLTGSAPSWCWYRVYSCS